MMQNHPPFLYPPPSAGFESERITDHSEKWGED